MPRVFRQGPGHSATSAFLAKPDLPNEDRDPTKESLSRGREPPKEREHLMTEQGWVKLQVMIVFFPPKSDDSHFSHTSLLPNWMSLSAVKVAEYTLTSLLEIIRNMFQLWDKWQLPCDPCWKDLLDSFNILD